MTYFLSWTDINGDSCSVIIRDTQDSSHDGVTLMPSASPFVTAYAADKDFLLPLRTGTGRIEFVGTYADILRFSGERMRYRVDFKRDGTLMWSGWLTPDVQTQSYSVVPDALTLNAADEVASLADRRIADEAFSVTVDGDDYDFAAEESVSIGMMICEAFAAASERYADYGFIFEVGDYDVSTILPLVFSRAVFCDLTTDGDGVEQKEMQPYSEALTAICRLFGWSLRQSGGFFIFDTPRKVPVYSRAYTFAELFAQDVDDETQSAPSVVGFGSEMGLHTIDVDAGFRRITVSADKADGGGNLPALDFGDADVILSRMDADAIASLGLKCKYAQKVLDNFTHASFVYARPVAGQQWSLTKLLADAVQANTSFCLPVREDYWAGTGSDKGSADTDAEKRNYEYYTRLYLPVLPIQSAAQTHVPVVKIEGKDAFTAGDAVALDIKISAGLYRGSSSDSEVLPTKDKIISETLYIYAFLRVGNVYWQGGDDAQAVNGWRENFASFPIRVDSGDKEYGDVVTNKSRQWQWTATGFTVSLPRFITDAPMEFGITAVACGDNEVYARQYCAINSLSIVECKRSSDVRDADKEREYRYTDASGVGTDDMAEVSLPLHSGDGEYLGNIYDGDGYPVDLLLKHGSTVTRVRPEKALLQKMQPYLSTRKYLTITQVIPTLTLTRHLHGGKVFAPVTGAEYDWTADAAKITYMQND